jgi:hypothetical protein
MSKGNKCEEHNLPNTYLSTDLESDKRFFCTECLKEESAKQKKEYLQSINDFLFSQNQPNKALLANLEAKSTKLASSSKKELWRVTNTLFSSTKTK